MTMEPILILFALMNDNCLLTSHSGKLQIMPLLHHAVMPCTKAAAALISLRRALR